MVLEEEEVLGLHSGQVAWRGVFTRLCRPEPGMAVQQEGVSKSGALTRVDLGRVCPRPGSGDKEPISLYALSLGGLRTTRMDETVSEEEILGAVAAWGVLCSCAPLLRKGS